MSSLAILLVPMRSIQAQLWYAGGECGIPYEYRFDMPYPTGEGATFTADNGNNYSSLWYSFDQGPGGCSVSQIF